MAVKKSDTTIRCRRCSSTEWALHTTTATVLETDTKQRRDLSSLKREYRCTSCEVKGTVDQHRRLDALVQQPGWKQST